MTPDALAPDPPPRTIFIIDDEAAVRNVTRTLLERAGFRVLTAGGGPEAVDLFATVAPEIDLVILDLTMPRMSGKQVLVELVAIRHDIRVLLASGYSHADGVPDQPNVAGFLHKPFRFEELLRTIGAAMG